MDPFSIIIYNKLVKDEVILLDEDYSGFSGSEFYVEREYVQGLYNIIENDDNIFEQIIEWHKVRVLLDDLELAFGIGGLINIAKKIIPTLPEKDALITIKREMILEYYSERKTAYERDMLACYLGIRSKLGKKLYCWTTKAEILRRMIGCTNQNNLADILRSKELKKVYDYYFSSNHKRLTKMLEVMEVKGFIVRQPTRSRRTYVTTRLSDIDLARAITTDLINEEVEEASFRERKNAISRNIQRIKNNEVKKQIDKVWGGNSDVFQLNKSK